MHCQVGEDYAYYQEKIVQSKVSGILDSGEESVQQLKVLTKKSIKKWTDKLKNVTIHESNEKENNKIWAKELRVRF